jgi:hypothetical protein
LRTRLHERTSGGYAHVAGRLDALGSRVVVGAREVGGGLDDGRHVTAEADQFVSRQDAIAERVEQVDGEALKRASEGG